MSTTRTPHRNDLQQRRASPIATPTGLGEEAAGTSPPD